MGLMGPFFIHAVGLWAPGLTGWNTSQTVFRGGKPYRADPALPPFTHLPLSRNERRRTTFAIRLALQVAQEALQQSGLSPAKTLPVFTCSGGDTEALDKLCTTIHLPGHPVSPQQFINSVHNAPLGYWSLAAHCQAAAISLCAYDASFAAGLLEAATLATVEQQTVLLVAYDVPPPPSLQPFRPIQHSFGVALLLGGQQRLQTLAKIRLHLISGHQENSMEQPQLEMLRKDNPAARCLPLLQQIAKGTPSQIVLAYSETSQLLIEYQPC